MDIRLVIATSGGGVKLKEIVGFMFYIPRSHN